MKKIILPFLLIFVLGITVFAQEGKKMTFQGSLYQSDQPFNGTTTLEFSIALDAGATWTETISDVNVINGLYSVVLGQTTPLPENLFFNANERIMTVKVDGVTLGNVNLYAPFGTTPGVPDTVDVDALAAYVIGIGTDTENNAIIDSLGNAIFNGDVAVGGTFTVGGQAVLTAIPSDLPGTTTIGGAQVVTESPKIFLDTMSLFALQVGPSAQDNIKLNTDGSAEFSGAVSASQLFVDGQQIIPGAGGGTLPADIVAVSVNADSVITGRIDVGTTGLSTISPDGSANFEMDVDAGGFNIPADGSNDFMEITSDFLRFRRNTDVGSSVFLTNRGFNGDTRLQLTSYDANGNVRSNNFFAAGQGGGYLTLNDSSNANTVRLNGVDGSATFSGDLEVGGTLTVNGQEITSGADRYEKDISGTSDSVGLYSRITGTVSNNAFWQSAVHGLANSTTGNNLGVLAQAAGANSNAGWVSGIEAMGFGANTGPRYGVRGVVRGEPTYSVAVLGYDESVQSDGGLSHGVYGRVFQGAPNATGYGVRGRAEGAGGRNVGIFGEALNGDENWAGWFDGAVKITGPLSMDQGFQNLNVQDTSAASFSVNIVNDPNGNDPNGTTSELFLFGDESPNIQMGGQPWENGDLAYFNLFGSNPDGGGWYYGIANISAGRDNGTGEEWGSLDLSYNDGTNSFSTFNVDGRTGTAFFNGDVTVNGNLNANINLGTEAYSLSEKDWEPGIQGFLHLYGDAGADKDNLRVDLGVDGQGVDNTTGRLNLMGPVYTDPNCPNCPKTFVSMNPTRTNDQGNDPGAYYGVVNIEGMNSPNVQIDADNFNDADAGVINIYGNEPDQNGWFYSHASIGAAASSNGYFGRLELSGSQGNSNISFGAKDWEGAAGINRPSVNFRGNTDTLDHITISVDDLDGTNETGSIGVRTNSGLETYISGGQVNVGDFFGGSGVAINGEFGIVELSDRVTVRNTGTEELSINSNSLNISGANQGPTRIALFSNNDGDGIDYGWLQLNNSTDPNPTVSINGKTGDAGFNGDVGFGRNIIDNNNPFLQDPNTSGYILQNDEFGLSFRMQGNAGQSLELDGDNGNASFSGNVNSGNSISAGGLTLTKDGFVNNGDSTDGFWIVPDQYIMRMTRPDGMFVNIDSESIDVGNSGDGTGVFVNGVAGDVNATGTVSASILSSSDGTVQTSDRRYKKNIVTLENSLSNVLTLRGVSYQWIDINKSQRNQIGVIAQEVEEIYPEFVHTDKDGYKAVNYSQITAVLIEAIKELNEKVESLETENAELKADAANASELESRIAQIEKLLGVKVTEESNASNK